MDKHVEAGRIEQIDLCLSPFRERDTSTDRHLPGDFLFVVVAGGDASVSAAHALVRARGVKGGGNERGFSSVSVADQGHVADVCTFVDLHGFTPSAGWEGTRSAQRSRQHRSSVVCQGSGFGNVDDQKTDNKWMRTGSGRPNITCQNLGCYHAGTWRLNLRCIVSSAISQCSQASGGRPRPPTPLATNEPDAYRPPRGALVQND